MSSDPFQQNDPQATVGAPTTPSPKKRNWILIFGVLGGISFLGLIVCCGVLTFAFSRMGSVFFEPVRLELNQLTQVQDSVGRVDKLTMNFGASTKEGQTNPGFVVLDAETEGEPVQFSVKLGSAGEIEDGYLIQADGTRTQLDLGGGEWQKEPDSDSGGVIAPTENEDPTDREQVPVAK